MHRQWKQFIGFTCLVICCGVFLFFHQQKLHQIQCQVLWGKAQVPKDKKCEITIQQSNEPALIETLLSQSGSFLKSNLVIHFSGSKLDAISGLEVRFFSQGKNIGLYTLPLFAETTLNLLQEGLDTTLSINWSSLKNKSDDLLDTPIDRLEIYLATTNKTELKLNIDSVQWLEKPKTGRVTLTFDDGYDDHYQAAKILSSFELVSTAYIIPEAIDTPNYLSREQLRALKKWGWEIGSHLVTPVTKYEASDLDLQLKKTLAQLQDLGSQGGEKQFAFPLGQYNLKSLQTVTKHLNSARLASGGIESLPPQEIFRLRTVNVTPSLSPDELVKLANQAILNGDWLILMFHYLDRPEKGDLSYPLDSFTDLAKGLSGAKANIKTVSEVLKENHLLQ